MLARFTLNINNKRRFIRGQINKLHFDCRGKLILFILILYRYKTLGKSEDNYSYE